MTSAKIMQAMIYAARMHGMPRDGHPNGQLRKYLNTPYVEHPIAVASICQKHGCDDHTVTVCMLHDTIEDTTATYGDISKLFGEAVAKDVVALTDTPSGSAVMGPDGKMQKLNRAGRKELDRLRLSQANARVHDVKLADMIHNTGSIVAHDPDFAVLYLQEKAATLPLLTRGRKSLMDLAIKTLNEGIDTLKASGQKGAEKLEHYAVTEAA